MPSVTSVLNLPKTPPDLAGLRVESGMFVADAVVRIADIDCEPKEGGGLECDEPRVPRPE